MFTTTNTHAEVESHKVIVDTDLITTQVPVQGHRSIPAPEVLTTQITVQGHAVEVQEETQRTYAVVQHHEVEVMRQEVKTPVILKTPEIAVELIKEPRVVEITVPEPRFMFRHQPYIIDMDPPPPPQGSKRDIITQTGGNEPPSPGSAADDALTDAEPVGSYSEEEADRESDPLLVIRRYPTPPRRDGQESRSEDDGEEEEDEDEDDWDGMETPRRTMLEQLKRIKKPRDVQRFINRWSRRPFPDDLYELDNVIYTCWARRRWTGAAQWPCPFCQAGYQTQQALSRHLEEEHSERLPKDLLSTTLGSICGKKGFWRIRVEGEEYTSRHLYQCPVSKCPYFSSCKTGYSSHMQRQHESCHELIAKLGPLWGTIVHEARTNNDIATMGQLRKDVKGFECPKCRCYFGQTKKTLAQHCSRVHADTRFEGRTIQPRRFEAWFSLHLDDATYERLQSRLLEDEREALERREAVRAALQASRHEPVTPPQQEENEERERRRRREEELRRRREADARMAEVLNTPRSSQERTMGEEMRDSQGETDDDYPRPDVDVIGRARHWLEQARLEEQRLETLPPLWGKRLKKAAAEIENLFRTDVSAIKEETQQLLDTYPDLDEEERWTLFDGALAHINAKLRSGLKRIIHAPRTETQRRRFRNRSSRTIRSAKKLIDMIRRMYESRQMPRTQTRLTAESQLAEAIEKSLKEVEEAGQLVAITDDGMIDLESLMEADREHFEARMGYISDNLKVYEREALGRESNSYKSMLQSMYNEDPNRVLKHLVFRDNHEECALTAQQLVETYGTTMSAPARYDDRDGEFEVERCLDGEDSELVWEYITDPDNIKEVLRTRSNLSAQGPDSLPYSVWKSGGQTVIDLIAWIAKEMKAFRRFPTTWKQAKTVFIPKDGDLREPRNWRPITITSTLYRIFMCLVSRALQTLNKRRKFINEAQHGFTKLGQYPTSSSHTHCVPKDSMKT